MSPVSSCGGVGQKESHRREVSESLRAVPEMFTITVVVDLFSAPVVVGTVFLLLVCLHLPVASDNYTQDLV